MTRRTATWVVGGLLILAGMLALSACGVTSVIGIAAKPTATPDAKTILAKLQKVEYKDIEFKLTLAGSSSGSSSSAAVSGDGSGVITTSPKRAQVSFNVTSGGQQFALDTIEDIDGNSVYVKFNTALIPGLPTDKWIKSDAGGALSSLTKAFDTSQISSFNQISNATLKGNETVDGVAVWHLAGTETSNGTTANADLYVRQDNYYPYKIIVHASGGASADATITFTGINTGATVTLPPADQVVTEPTPATP
jgi:hypothetical protein